MLLSLVVNDNDCLLLVYMFVSVASLSSRKDEGNVLHLQHAMSQETSIWKGMLENDFCMHFAYHSSALLFVSETIACRTPSNSTHGHGRAL